jgi:protein-S-isoprenylcysteine O-methyltransferase Ste14
MLTLVAIAELIVCWLLWSFAFIGARKKAASHRPVIIAPAGKWGILLQALGFAMIGSYIRPREFQKPAASLIASMILAPACVALAWSAARHLGKQWRFQAALSEDHELIQTGPYRWVRHPIYASMLGMLLATGFGWTWWPMFACALIVFLAGTEIRVRAEDRLLAGRFKDSFAAYRRRVRAYIPFVR